jgi:hypothetical protein
MFGKKILWAVFAVCFLMNAGCCRMWEHWCERPHPMLHPGAGYCAPAPQQCCPAPAHPCYSPPPPTVAPVSTADWRRGAP